MSYVGLAGLEAHTHVTQFAQVMDEEKDEWIMGWQQDGQSKETILNICYSA